MKTSSQSLSSSFQRCGLPPPGTHVQLLGSTSDAKLPSEAKLPTPVQAAVEVSAAGDAAAENGSGGEEAGEGGEHERHVASEGRVRLVARLRAAPPAQERGEQTGAPALTTRHSLHNQALRVVCV